MVNKSNSPLAPSSFGSRNPKSAAASLLCWGCGQVAIHRTNEDNRSSIRRPPRGGTRKWLLLLPPPQRRAASLFFCPFGYSKL
ncbi:hypothetical protein SFRURICE_014003 [Spodoptera frugiperda]|nr:hypothetical protein SFRURICE_014003 [Spodoptera frugiperda]